MNKFSIIFLIAIFSSIVLNPLFIKNGIPEGFTVISQALGEESSDSDGGDSGDDEKDDDSGDDEKDDDSGDDEKDDDSGDDEKDDDSGDD
ncbi:MAG: hypothetical protein QOK78_09525, partial [Nitrososphaeraceae archaeon]|nr:hypothetical protein [Nitrososphaeraceae archaeon]